MHVDEVDEYSSNEYYFLEPRLLTKLSNYLRDLFGEIIVRVDSLDDGPAVRVVVREKNWDVVERIVEAVRCFERENNLKAPIIVHVDEVDEV